MLDATALPTIRHAIRRRLDTERGVAICEILTQPCATHITVGVLAQIDGVVIVKSMFDLPLPFELGHLHNEIDEIAESMKAARRDYLARGGHFLYVPETKLPGTGLRGRWGRYG